MGAQQSSAESQDQAGTGGSPKTCYYELLGVERQATDLEIKKAYRRKALELHPDRNLNDVQAATKKFAEVQTAYEILSDPQERAWYDSHREAVLSGQDGTDGDNEPTTYRNVRLTSAKEIMSLIRRFNADVPFNDEPMGFFGITRETFEHLALEEEAAADIQGVDCPTYPTFGSSDDDYETTVRAFYTSWAGFSTKKSFSWRDKYRLSDAPDRRVRRLMERENKSLREEAIREFNDAVRFLLAFVRKRDPRYLSNMQTASDRQESLRSASAAQAARSRAAHQAKMSTYEVPEWARHRDEDLGQSPSSDGEDALQEEDSEVEILECVVCNKTFKSGQQLEAHERSKKHAKAVQQLRRQMRKEGVDLKLDSGVATPSEGQDDRDDQRVSIPRQQSGASGASIEGRAGSEVDLTDERGSNQHVTNGDDSLHRGPGDSGDSDAEDTDAPPASETATSPAVGESSTSRHDTTEGLADSLADVSLGGDTVQEKKIGKAKAKRQKKAAAVQASENEHRCSVCRTAFTSRTKLFNHINAENHAAPVPKAASGGAKNKRKG